MTIAVNSYATSGTFTGSLTVNSGITLCLSGTAAIALTDIFTNNGTINHTASGGFTASHDVTNSGKITTTTAGFSQSSTLKTMTNNAGGVMFIAGNITMEGDIINAGIIQSTGGTFTKTSTSNYYHGLTGGMLISYGNIRLEGTIENCGQIEISNSGTLTNIGTADPFTNSAGSTIIIRGTGLTSQIESEFYNYGRIIIEGNWLQTADADDFYNYAGGYVRVCGNFSIKGVYSNYANMEVMGEFKHTNGSDHITNYAGGVLNITDDLDIITSMINQGCITIGDSLWKRNTSSEDITISNGGTIFTSKFIHDNGSLIGGGTSGNRGYLRISGLSTTLNDVPLSGYLDLTDEGHIGVSPYFDNQSPVYSYPTANMTDGGTAPCTKATLIACGADYPAGSGGSCATVPLPIELVGFIADCNNGKMDLNWTTATETNNDYFTIERTKDGLTYDVVGIVDSKAINGTSTQTLSYTFTDNSFPKEELGNTTKLVYYRLKQTDFDGNYTYSEIQAASCTPYCIGDISILSDHNDVLLNLFSVCSVIADFTVYNALGQIVLVKREHIETGNNTIKLDANDMAAGLYVIKVGTLHQTIQKKFGKQ